MPNCRSMALPSSSQTSWSIPPRASPCSPPQLTCSSPYISRSRARSLGAPLSWIWMRKTKYLPAGDPTRWSSPLNHCEPPPLQPTHGDDPRGHQRGPSLISLTRSALEPLARVGQPWQEILVKIGAMGRYMDSQCGPQHGRLVVRRPSSTNEASARQTLAAAHLAVRLRARRYHPSCDGKVERLGQETSQSPRNRPIWGIQPSSTWVGARSSPCGV